MLFICSRRAAGFLMFLTTSFFASNNFVGGFYSRWVTPIVMTLYLLVANILIINILIAVFNNIYQQECKSSRRAF
jgi:uncharacterized membrane protein